MLNERLERIYKDGINNYIVPMINLNLEENPTIVFDIESCGLENNTKALTYSIAVMSATNESDISIITHLAIKTLNKNIVKQLLVCIRKKQPRVRGLL